MKHIKSIIFLIVMIVLIGVVGFFGYMTYVDSNSSEAKKYLIERYGLNEKDVQPKEYIQYVYADIADCSSLWVKKCTSDKTLAFQYVFVLKDGTKITVSEDDKGNLTDNYDKEPIIKDEDNTDNSNNNDSVINNEEIINNQDGENTNKK